MLQAIIHKKKRLNFKYYWEYEDNITSSFFGSFQYFGSGIVCSILLQIFPTLPTCTAVASSRNISFNFWPRIGREPDLLIHINNSSNIKCLHIEVKWDARESSKKECVPEEVPSAKRKKHQVLEQRKDVLREYCLESDQLHSIYLVKNKDKARSEFEMNSLDEVHIVSWVEVARRLRDWRDSPDTCEFWRKDVVDYLREMTGDVFEGFSSGKGKVFPDDFGFLQRLNPCGKIFFVAFHGFSFHVPKDVCDSRGYVFYRRKGK